MRGKIISAGLLVIMLAAGAVHAEGKNVRWAVTVNMSMTQPMSMKMPAYTSKVCGPANPEKQPPPMKNGDCKVENFDKSGQKVSYKVVCDQKGMSMTGEGWAEKTDDDHYRGHMTIKGNSGGTPMAMEMDYTGERIGTCTEEGVEQ